MDLLSAVYWLSLNCYHEARGEPELGQIYVAATVLNRAEKNNQSVKEVVNAPGQFSWTFQEVGRRPIKNSKAFLKCAELSIKAANMPISREITHYHADYVRPSWASKLKRVAKVGRHIFYKEK